MTIKAFDTSRHNHEMVDPHPDGLPIDFAAAYVDGYRIWIGRASVGNYYIDPWFQRDFDAAKAAGFIVMAYHVTHPELTTESQITNFLKALGDRHPDAIVIDSEVSGGQSADRCTECLFEHAEVFTILLDDDPDRVLCYTNANYANKYLLATDELDLIVANPGYQNGMNTNPSPAMPELWDEYLGWQKDWKHFIPGVPDYTTDYSEFEMELDEALERFKYETPTTPPTSGECDLSEVLDKLDLVLENQALILAKLNETPTPPSNPDPDPTPAPKYYVALKVDKTNTRFVYGWKTKKDGNKVPIMQIYPSDSSLVKDRIQILKTQHAKVEVYPPSRIEADGTDQYFYKLVNFVGRNGEELYIDAHDCMKTW